jgi:signal peptidase I
VEIPIRHKGLFFSSYWQVVSDVYAGVGDVVVVKNASDYVVIRRVPKSRHWIDDAQLRIAGVSSAASASTASCCRETWRG